MRSGSPHRSRLSPITQAGTLHLPPLYIRMPVRLPPPRFLRVFRLDHYCQLSCHISTLPARQLPQFGNNRRLKSVRSSYFLSHRSLFPSIWVCIDYNWRYYTTEYCSCQYVCSEICPHWG